jgi:hypothetical protein
MAATPLMAVPWAARFLLVAVVARTMMATVRMAANAASRGGDEAERNTSHADEDSLATVHLLHDCSPHHQ